MRLELVLMWHRNACSQVRLSYFQRHNGVKADYTFILFTHFKKSIDLLELKIFSSNLYTIYVMLLSILQKEFSPEELRNIEAVVETRYDSSYKL